MMFSFIFFYEREVPSMSKALDLKGGKTVFNAFPRSSRSLFFFQGKNYDR